MWSLSNASRTRIAVGLLLFATAAPVLNVAAEPDIIDVEPGGLQTALDNVKPGDTLKLKKGEYWETVVTKINGLPDAYITIQGESDQYDAILKGDVSINNDGRIFNIEHSYYILDGFKIDGKHSDENFVDKCLYVQQNRENPDKAEEIEFNGHRFRSSINGLVISNMEITNCGGECVRMRYFITYAQVYGNTITNCGEHDFNPVYGSNAKNGEGIYLGTSSNQWDDMKNATPEDVSCYNHFFGNHFDTQGNEGIDIKEGSQFNIVEDNYCTGQKDPNSACLDSRGDYNIFRYNTCVGNLGAGVRIGGHEIDGKQYGENNEVYGNILQDNDYAGIKIMMGPQGAFCDNDISGSSKEKQGGEIIESVFPSLSCGDIAGDIANNDIMPPVENDASENEGSDDDDFSDDYYDDDYADDDDSEDDDDFEPGQLGDDQTCSNDLPGFEASGVCCPISCGRCGGSGCSDIGKECCTSDVKDTKITCSESGAAPCIIDGSSSSDSSSESSDSPAESSDSPADDSSSSDDVEEVEVVSLGVEKEQVDDAQKCSNGLPGYEDSDVCCPVSCGRCGGSGCSALGEGCCTSDVKDTNIKCSESKSAPCNIDTETVDVSSADSASSAEEEEEQQEEGEVHGTGRNAEESAEESAEETEAAPATARDYLDKEEFEPPTI